MNSVEQFFQEFSQDQSLQQQLQSQEKREEKLNKLVELGQEKGYNFTSNEVEQWLQSRSQELSDADLDAVAGGNSGDSHDMLRNLLRTLYDPLGNLGATLSSASHNIYRDSASNLGNALGSNFQ